MADHIVRCPHGLRLAGQPRSLPSAVTCLHARLVQLVVSVFLAAGAAPSSLVVEPSHLVAGDAAGRRPADVLVRSLSFHVWVDVSAVAVLSTFMAQPAAGSPGSVAASRERAKVRGVVGVVPSTVTYVPFVVEQFGRLGMTADAFLRAMAVHSAGGPGSGGGAPAFQQVGYRAQPGAPSRPPLDVSGIVALPRPRLDLSHQAVSTLHSWQQRLSTIVHGTQAEFLEDCVAGAGRAGSPQ